MQINDNELEQSISRLQQAVELLVKATRLARQLDDSEFRHSLLVSSIDGAVRQATIQLLRLGQMILPESGDQESG